MRWEITAEGAFMARTPTPKAALETTSEEVKCVDPTLDDTMK
jgi:hypothetical protein